MSDALITIEPTRVYDTSVLRDTLGESLWRKVGPQLPRLVRGHVLGEDVLKVLRELSAANARHRATDVPPALTPRVAHAIIRKGEVSNEGAPSRKPLRISDDCLAR